MMRLFRRQRAVDLRRVGIARYQAMLVMMLVVMPMHTVVRAQAVAPAGAVHITSTIASDTIARLPSLRDDHDVVIDVLTRIGFGIAGSLLGTAAGAVLGAVTARPCGGEECELRNVVTLGAVGSVLGAATLAAMPKLSSKCSSGERILTGVAGSAAGAVVGGLAGRPLGLGGPFLGLLIGGSLGGGVGARLCR